MPNQLKLKKIDKDAILKVNERKKDNIKYLYIDIELSTNYSIITFYQ